MRLRVGSTWAARTRRIRTGGSWVTRGATETVLFTDTFTRPLTDQWQVSASGVTTSAGQLVVSTAGVVAGDYPVVETLTQFNLTGAAYAVKVAQTLPASGGNYETFIEAGATYTDRVCMFTHQWGFEGFIDTAGTRETFALPAYNATSHAWWRIREASGRFYFETAPDGATWTSHGSLPYTWSAASCHLICKAGYWGATVPAVEVAKFDEATLTV